MRPFHVLSNPVGALCNLDCKYCYYLEKEHLSGSATSTVMQDDVLESFVRQYITQQVGSEINFLWQGGEPTLAGFAFYERAVALQHKYSDGRRITNAIQTNATLLDDNFCRFLKRHDFLVGVSVDGPSDIHDSLRKTKGGRDTFAQTMRGLELLKKHQVPFNLLCVVHSNNATQPLRVYEFLKAIGGQYIQFLPLVERLKQKPSADGTRLALPTYDEPSVIMPWSVKPKDYGNFLCDIFDHWFSHDVGQVFVQLFDVTLENWLGLEPALCIFRSECGGAIGLEKNGDVYSCDHYVFPEYRLGNIQALTLDDMVRSPAQQAFGSAKKSTLPQQCIECEVYFACKGECPKNRFALTAAGEPGLNYLCEGYLAFFKHVFAAMNHMASAVDPSFVPRVIQAETKQ